MSDRRSFPSRLYSLAPWAVGAAYLASGGHALGFRVQDWIVTQWLFSYDQEFVRRGLVGAVLRFFISPDSALIGNLALVLLFTCSLSMVVFAVWCTKSQSPSLACLLAVIAIACPASLAQFAFDVGRFDQLNLVLFVLALAVVIRRPRGAGVWIALLTMLGLLVHEAFLA